MQQVNRLLQESAVAGAVEQQSEEEASNDEWDGFPDQPDLEIVDHEEEYIDEDRYTTVTVESVSVTREGLHKPQVDEPEDKDDKKDEDAAAETGKTQNDKSKKKKKKKFHYESKFDRQLTERKQKAKGRSRRA